MPRPESVTNEDLLRWSETIDNDPLVDESLAQNPIIREVCYAGQWLADQLTKIECPDHLIGQMMYTAGAMCYGRKDPWIVHQDIYIRFVAGELEFQVEPNELN
jgi:hypothetical protein